jgi:hypothetical protein
MRSRSKISLVRLAFFECHLLFAISLDRAIAIPLLLALHQYLTL